MESGLEAVESAIPHLQQSWRDMTPSEIDCGQFGVVVRMSNLDPGVKHSEFANAREERRSYSGKAGGLHAESLGYCPCSRLSMTA